MRFIVLFITFLCVVTLSAQIDQPQETKVNFWNILSKVDFEKEYNDLLGFEIEKPIFSDKVREWDGKYIHLKGYIIPTNGYKNHQEFVFSAFPYNMCYFCGGAGPETVVEIYARRPITYTAEPIELEGRLKLNEEDASRLMYWLEDAVLVE